MQGLTKIKIKRKRDWAFFRKIVKKNVNRLVRYCGVILLAVGFLLFASWYGKVLKNSADVKRKYVNGEYASAQVIVETPEEKPFKTSEIYGYYVLGIATQENYNIDKGKKLDLEQLELVGDFAEYAPYEASTKAALQLDACLRIEQTLKQYGEQFTPEAVEKIGEALARLKEVSVNFSAGEDVIKELGGFGKGLENTDNPLERLRALDNRMCYLEAEGYYHLARLYAWYQAGGWEAMDSKETQSTWVDKLNVEILGEADEYGKRLQEALENLFQLYSTPKNDIEPATILKCLLSDSECDLAHNWDKDIKGRSRNERDRELTDSEKEYYRRGHYLQGCYQWYNEFDTNREITRESDDAALEEFFYTAYLGEGQAMLRLAEIYHYGIKRYINYSESEVNSSYFKKFSKEEKTENARVLANRAAEELGQLHGYTILARIAYIKEDMEQVLENIKKAISPEGKEEADSFALNLFYILNIELVDEVDTSEFDKLVEASKQEEVYARANIGTYYANIGKIDMMKQYRQDALKFGCEVAAYRMAEYYADKDDDLSERYQNLAKLVRDINYSEIVDMD